VQGPPHYLDKISANTTQVEFNFVYYCQLDLSLITSGTFILHMTQKKVLFLNTHLQHLSCILATHLYDTLDPFSVLALQLFTTNSRHGQMVIRTKEHTRWICL
jgi:hypothetical protein